MISALEALSADVEYRRTTAQVLTRRPDLIFERPVTPQTVPAIEPRPIHAVADMPPVERKRAPWHWLGVALVGGAAWGGAALIDARGQQRVRGIDDRVERVRREEPLQDPANHRKPVLADPRIATLSVISKRAATLPLKFSPKSV